MAFQLSRSTSSRRKVKSCIICRETATNMRRHVYEVHLPYFWDPCCTCFTCKDHLGSQGRLRKLHLEVHTGQSHQFRNLEEYMGRVISCLKRISQEVVQSTQLSHLFQHVCDKQWYPAHDGQRVDFDYLELMLLQPFQVFWGEVGVQPHVSPPSGLVSLLHWRVMIHLLAALSPETQQMVKMWDGIEEVTGVQVPITDAHFHLDVLQKVTQLSSFRQIETSVTFGTGLLPLQVAVANYVYPSSWSQVPAVDEDTRLYFTVGLHPHMVEHTVSISYLLSFLSHPKCVGIGEVGLDYTSNCRCRDHRSRAEWEKCKSRKRQRQEDFLASLLPQLHTQDCTIIIHTNGEGADQRMMDLLREYGLINHRVHWHCFTGSPHMAMQILGELPNAKLSFSSRSMREDHMVQVIKQTPLESIVLETDSPYLDSFHQRLNTPWTIQGHAQKVAHAKNIPLEVLLLIVYHNLRELYKLPLAGGTPMPVATPPVHREYFQGPGCILSNMYVCWIQFRGCWHNSSEQAYQFQRALHINAAVAKKIRRSTGMEAKKLSKQLPLAKRVAWNEQHSIPTMKELLKEKAEQVLEFRQYLMESEGHFLLEATYDRFWGIGALEGQAATSSLTALPGKNVLGWLLVQLRNQYTKRPLQHLAALYQAHPGVPFFEGIAYVLGRTPSNRD